MEILEQILAIIAMPIVKVVMGQPIINAFHVVELDTLKEIIVHKLVLMENMGIQ